MKLCDEPPDLGTRIALLQRRAAAERCHVPGDVVLLIASSFSDERDLEGALVRLIAHSSLVGSKITAPYAQEVLKNFLSGRAQPRIRRLL